MDASGCVGTVRSAYDATLISAQETRMRGGTQGGTDSPPSLTFSCDSLPVFTPILMDSQYKQTREAQPQTLWELRTDPQPRPLKNKMDFFLPEANLESADPWGWEEDPFPRARRAASPSLSSGCSEGPPLFPSHAWSPWAAGEKRHPKNQRPAYTAPGEGGKRAPAAVLPDAGAAQRQ